jgi:hypothetical protein
MAFTSTKRKINPKTFSRICCKAHMLFYAAHHMLWNVEIFIFLTDFISGTRKVNRIMDNFPENM